MPRVVLSSYNNIYGLAKELHNMGKFELFTHSPQFANSLNEMDVPCNSFLSVSSPAMREEAFRQSSFVVRDLLQYQPDNGIPEGISEFLKNRITAQMYQKIPDAIFAILALDAIKPDIVVLHNDVEPMTRAMAMWAKAHDVPCLHVPHAVYIDTGIERGEPGTDVHDLITASYLAASGYYQRRWYEKRGFNPDNIRETGLPHFDQFPKKIKDRNVACRMLRVDPDRPVVSYMSSWRQDTNLLGCHDGVEQTFRTFLKAMEQVNGAQIIVKVHPNSSKASREWHVEEIKKSNVNAALTHAHLDSVVSASDFILAYGPSNVLLEAAFGSARLATTHGYMDDDEVIKIGNEPEVNDIADAIRDSLSKPAPPMYDFIIKYCGTHVGKSTELVANWIDEICQLKA